ncbi:MAG: hypothetical protein PWR03_977 [Tenuifilum sp.]|jgi:hypothetical protein|uniref:Zinc ribbon domain-containing protein n=1 Tax=Tenuifilum thalassicum TaxID=2590900 RepID=A0A7D4BQU7_9BACT|nr:MULTISPECIES: hypothetical protein [Tenuifilum]MDI3526794.1 hypothetical protein [Tenuifilum sp.]QKG79141.1 hypothetical protein FHG85_02305 [Tenuifilum thalassicum]
METYICKSCNIKFEADGVKTEWVDAAFGPCSKLTAPCPECGKECDEYRTPKQNSSESYNMSHTPPCGSCCGGCGL